MALTVRTITDLDVRAVSGKFLIQTRSGAFYTISCLSRKDCTILLSGGSCNLREVPVQVPAAIIRINQSIIYGGGNTTSVQAIYDITELLPHQIAQLARMLP